MWDWGALTGEQHGASSARTQHSHRRWNLSSDMESDSWSKTVAVARDAFLHADGTLVAALSLPSAGSPVWLLGQNMFRTLCLVHTFPPVCSNVCKSGISPAVNKTHWSSLVPETATAHGRQPTQGRFVVGGVQAQSVIKVLVLFHRERQPFLFFLLVSFHFVCRISAHRPELWRRGWVQSL